MLLAALLGTPILTEDYLRECEKQEGFLRDISSFRHPMFKDMPLNTKTHLFSFGDKAYILLKPSEEAPSTIEKLHKDCRHLLEAAGAEVVLDWSNSDYILTDFCKEDAPKIVQHRKLITLRKFANSVVLRKLDIE